MAAEISLLSNNLPTTLTLPLPKKKKNAFPPQGLPFPTFSFAFLFFLRSPFPFSFSSERVLPLIRLKDLRQVPARELLPACLIELA